MRVFQHKGRTFQLLPRNIAVAEGVEREGTRQALRALGCDRYQGFLLTKALPPDELVQWLSALEAQVRPLAVA